MRLVADHVWTYIEGDCPASIIDSETSYRVHGAWFAQSYKRGHWDGMKRFREFDRKRGIYRIPTGFLGAVCAKLDALDYPYTLEDGREIEIPELSASFADGTRMEGKFAFQSEVVETALGHGRGVIQAPTGAGKSVIGAALIKSYSLPTLWLTHRQILLHQTKRVLEDKLGHAVGMVGDSVCEPQRVTVGMVQSLTARDEEPAIRALLKNTQLLIGDEVHHLVSESWWDLFSSVNAPYRYGLTATSCLDGLGKHLVAMTGGVIAEVRLRDLIDSGVLVKPRIWFVRAGAPTLPADCSYNTIYGTGIVGNYERNTKIVLVVKTLLEERKPAVTLVRHVKHGKLLTERLCLEGIDAEFIQGAMPDKERDRLLKKLQEGKSHVVAQSEILGEGVDLPWLAAIINATGTRGGGSKRHGAEHEVGRSTVQYIGRVLRSAPGKDHAEYIDILDTCHRALRSAARERITALEEQGFTPWIDYWENRR